MNNTNANQTRILTSPVTPHGVPIKAERRVIFAAGCRTSYLVATEADYAAAMREDAILEAAYAAGTQPRRTLAECGEVLPKRMAAL